MADKMIFPETVEEFMEQNKIVDSDQVYTNGSELVPIQRMKQWFEHKRGQWTEKQIVQEHGDEPIIDEWQSASCSECGRYHTTPFMYFFHDYNYCPYCGADMRGGRR